MPNPQKYNCYECAIATSKNETPNFLGSRAPDSNDFAELIGEDYKDVTGKANEYVFGKTILSFNDKSWNIFEGAVETPIHGAIYLGTSKDGTVYTWSKNGWSVVPAVKTKKELETDTYDDTDKVRYYNRNN